MTKAKKPISSEESALFQAAVQGVRPLRASNKVQLTQELPKKRHSLQRPFREQAAPRHEFSDSMQETVLPEQVLLYAQAGLPPQRLRELKQGKIRPSAILDLHGYTVEQARSALAHIIDTSVERGVRCLLVIHGKGKLQNTLQPVLKNQVNNWLRQHPQILAFCSAQAVDGGTGAVYVLLKRLRVEAG